MTETSTRTTTVGELSADDIGREIEVHCPGRPRGEYRGSAASNDDEGGMTVLLRESDGNRRSVGCRDATPVTVR